jgi:hypothetical protein
VSPLFEKGEKEGMKKIRLYYLVPYGTNITSQYGTWYVGFSDNDVDETAKNEIASSMTCSSTLRTRAIDDSFGVRLIASSRPSAEDG